MTEWYAERNLKIYDAFFVRQESIESIADYWQLSTKRIYSILNEVTQTGGKSQKATRRDKPKMERARREILEQLSQIERGGRG